MNHDALLPSLTHRMHLVERFSARPGAYRAAPDKVPRMPRPHTRLAASPREVTA